MYTYRLNIRFLRINSQVTKSKCKWIFKNDRQPSVVYSLRKAYANKAVTQYRTNPFFNKTFYDITSASSQFNYFYRCFNKYGKRSFCGTRFLRKTDHASAKICIYVGGDRTPQLGNV